MVADDIAEYAATTVRKHFFVLRGIPDDAVIEGRLARNPCEGVKLRLEDTPNMRFLDPDQVAALVVETLPYYRPLVDTAAYVGLRWDGRTGRPQAPEGRPAPQDDHGR